MSLRRFLQPVGGTRSQGSQKSSCSPTLTIASFAIGEMQRGHHADGRRGEFGNHALIIVFVLIFVEPASNDDLVISLAEDAHARS
jgi:hypothetical protein